LLQWQGEGCDHGYWYGDDEQITAYVEGRLHNGEVLECGALRIWWRDGPVAIKWSACCEKGDFDSDPANDYVCCDKSDPFDMRRSYCHACEHKEHACFQDPDYVQHALLNVSFVTVKALSVMYLLRYDDDLGSLDPLIYLELRECRAALVGTNLTLLLLR
jgi:hypothetical protein